MSTTTLDRPVMPAIDPLAVAIAGIENIPDDAAQAALEQPAKTKELVIVNWSGELDKVWPVLILSSTAAASGASAEAVIREMMAIGPTDWVLLVPNRAYRAGGTMLAYRPTTGGSPATRA